VHERKRSPAFCLSIDVERDYRLDGRVTSRGIDEGLPVYLDLLRSLGIPYDLYVSGEIVPQLSDQMSVPSDGLGALGCHGLTHEPGVRSYLSRKPRSLVAWQLRTATERVHSRFGRNPTHFRAPNFSTSAETISMLERLGYRTDSSVLPGRHVRRWKVIPILDHRNAPLDPYHPDRRSVLREGDSSVLEVPVTPNPLMAGSPLGLGFLHHSGPESVTRAIARVCGRYLIFLAHSWEMVSWEPSDPVADWVVRSSSPSTKALEQLLRSLEKLRFVNMDRIVAESGA